MFERVIEIFKKITKSLMKKKKHSIHPMHANTGDHTTKSNCSSNKNDDTYILIATGGFSRVYGKVSGGATGVCETENDICRFPKKKNNENVIREYLIQSELADRKIALPTKLIATSKMRTVFGKHKRCILKIKYDVIDRVVVDSNIKVRGTLGMSMERLKTCLYDKYGDFNIAIPNDEFIKDVLSLIEIVLTLHDMGLVHQDIKPDNVGIRENGEVVLLDFEFTSLHQETVQLCGTPAYIPPERLLKYSRTTKDPKAKYFSDIYALVMTICFMLKIHVNHFLFHKNMEGYGINNGGLTILQRDTDNIVLMKMKYYIILRYNNLYQHRNIEFEKLMDRLTRQDRKLWDSSSKCDKLRKDVMEIIDGMKKKS